jgi:GntR family transcriptional regulator, transcriptional repressor for pyruvate dehydrogenase complex
MPKQTFTRIDQSDSLSKKVEQQIRQAIQTKVFLPGDKLPSEIALAATFGVSRTAVREAIRMLAGRGLVNIRKGSGIYVAEIDINSVVDPFYQLLEYKFGDDSLLYLLRVRQMIEPEIARLAALHRREEDLIYLEHNFLEMQHAAEMPVQMIDFDIQYHRRLAMSTNNPTIPIVMEPIFRLLNKFISSTFRHSHAPTLALEYHKLLLKNLHAGDGDAAYQTMRDHLASAEAHLTAYYTEQKKSPV